MSIASSTFVPAQLDATEWSNIEPLFNALLERSVESAADLEAWLFDRSELESAYSQSQANLYISTTCDTGDQAAQDAFTKFIETVPPKAKPVMFAMDRRQKELAERFSLPADRYGVLTRDTAADVELYRDENVPIETELDKLGQESDTVSGAQSVEFEGKERTMPEMARFLEDTDRPRRESAWRAISDRRLQDREKFDTLYDAMIGKRDQLARNAGYDNYVGYTFARMHRFDYTPDHCVAFHDAVERAVVPFNKRLDAKRAEALGVDALRPWDLAVDPHGRAPLRPFEGGVDLMNKTNAAFEQLDPRLAAMLRELGDGSGVGIAGGNNLDLDSRKGKAPGGYQYMRDRVRMPFIFMNAAGLHRDVETMVHEAGHAFHSMLCRDEPLLHYRHSPIEFAEVASMTMELLTMPYWGGEQGFYPDQADLYRAMRQQMEGSVSLLSVIATIDAFQHWIYTNPTHTQSERTSAWLDLDARFGHDIDWSGLDDAKAAAWQRQSHLFRNPFYYIEYGIAQLGALGLWVTSLEKGEPAAIDAYMKSLSLGGSKPLPELFEAAGLPFDFGYDTVARLLDRVETELEKVPDA